MTNNSIVNITYGQTATKPVFQWDYGQTLVFDGFGEMLPDVGFEVHFANPADETSVTSIGTADGVVIPDALLQTGLSVIVWVYLHDTATDGETEYRFTIPVARRAMPDNGEVTPEQADVIDQAIAALQVGVSRAETAADNSEASETSAAASAAAAAGSASSAYGDAERAETAAGSAEGFSQSASESEGAAQGYAAAAAASAAAASGSETNAATSASSAQVSASAAISAAQTAQSAESSASASAAAAAASATSANQSATTATAQATAAAASASSAGTSADNASASETSAAASAAAASASETAAAASATSAAESAATATAAAGSIPQVIVSPFYSTKDYFVGNYVVHNGTIYRFTADHAAGAWIGTDATTVVLADEVGELKNAVLQSNTGRETFYGDAVFQRGKLTNGVFSALTYRVACDTLISYSRDLLVKIANGFEVEFHFFENNAYVYKIGFAQKGLLIPKNSNFKICIKKVTEDTSVDADIHEFVNALTFDTLVWNETCNGMTITPPAASVSDGYYMVNSGGKLVGSTSTIYKTFTPIDISGLDPGTEVWINTSLSGNYGAFIADADNNVLDYVNGNNAEAKGYVTDSSPAAVKFVLPAGAKYIVSDIRNTYYHSEAIFSVYYYRDDFNVLNDKIDAVASAITYDGNVLSGKKWTACGDSFTAGNFDDSLTNDYVFTSGKYIGENKVYPFWIGNRNTELTVINEAIGGSTMGAGDNGINPFSGSRYTAVAADSDIITLEFGINDAGHGVPLGTIDDATNETFYGAWNVVLDYFTQNFPFAHIGIIVGPGLQTATGQQYAEAEIAIAKKWGIPYLNIQFESGGERIPLMLRTSNPDVLPAVRYLRNSQQYVNPSESTPNHHPNEKAHEFESWFIEAWLRTL